MRAESFICCFEYDLPLGRFRIEANNTALLRMIFVNDATPMPKQGTIVSETHLINRAYLELLEYFEKKRKHFDLPLSPSGTPFQKKVWAELCKIPYGRTVCYQDVARAIGNEKALRAVGGANNKNPLPIFIPCHRVIGKNGKLTGYAGGLDLKAALLELERSNCEYLEFNDLEKNILKSKDKKLAACMDSMPFPYRERFTDLFYALVDAIVSQQISTAAKETILRRLQARLSPVTAEGIWALSPQELAATGMGPKKAAWLRSAAEEVLSGRLDLEGLKQLPDSQVVERLTQLPGVGRYTAEMMLIFALGRQDVFCAQDLGIKKGLMKLYGHQQLTSELFAQYKKRFSPFGTLASLYLWQLAQEPREKKSF